MSDRTLTCPDCLPRRSRLSDSLRHPGVAWLRRIASRTSVAALVLALASCGDRSHVGDGPPPCDASYAGQCGTSCMTDQGCPTGLFCGPDFRCTADCAPGVRGCAQG